uniref:Uncharacterized protein n=1 Tax=Percolomonas cosmopolitus TaxID=63605 RepID=A0A7S1KV38_9EUKA|mmetsp:Transcript_9809/g.36600  ORF Transcript_9809/g.36600 Transcript_9809/m.36600 type:complete len:481 (+) Transcript_9809:28-1470(+)
MPSHFVLLFDTTSHEIPGPLRSLYTTLHKQIRVLHPQELFSLQILNEVSMQKQFIQEGPFVSRLHEWRGSPVSEHAQNPQQRIARVMSEAFKALFTFLQNNLGAETMASVFIIMDKHFAHAPLSDQVCSILPRAHTNMHLMCPVEGAELRSWARFAALHHAHCNTTLHTKDRIIDFVGRNFQPYSPAYLAYGHMLHPIALHRDPTLYDLRHLLPNVLSIQAFIDTSFVHTAKSLAKFTIFPSDTQRMPSAALEDMTSTLASSASIIDSYATNPWTRTDPNMNFLHLLAKIILEKSVTPVVTLDESHVALILPLFKKTKYDLTLNIVCTSTLRGSSEEATPWLTGNIHTMLLESVARAFSFSAEERSQSLYKCPARSDSLNVLSQDATSVRQCFDKIQRLLHGGADRWHICVKECERVRLTGALYKNQSLVKHLISLLEKENVMLRSNNVSQIVEHLKSKPMDKLGVCDATEGGGVETPTR